MPYSPPKNRLKRREREGEIRFLTCSCNHRLPLFKNPTIRNLFAQHLAAARAKFSFRLYAWVIMPEHIHLLLTPPVPHATVSTILTTLKGDFAKQVINRWRELKAPILKRITDSDGRPHFWLKGGGYDRNIRDDEELQEKLHYIHENPVKRGLVKDAIDWPWSSAAWYRNGKPGLVEIDPWYPMPKPPNDDKPRQ